MDIDPRCADVAVRRWQAFTALDAVLAGEDRVFGDIEAVRTEPRIPSVVSHR